MQVNEVLMMLTKSIAFIPVAVEQEDFTKFLILAASLQDYRYRLSEDLSSLASTVLYPNTNNLK